MNKLKLMLCAVFSVGLCCIPSTWSSSPKKNKPDHVLILLFDAMRPDYVDRYKLKNFQRLRTKSEDYANATAGHLFSETVVAHEVIPTGLPSRELPWSDELFFDREGLLGQKGLVYQTGSMKGADYIKVLSTFPASLFLTNNVKSKLGKKVFSVANKHYSAYIFGGPHADSIITMRKNKETGKCEPEGKNIPEYILKNDRFVLDCANPHGSQDAFFQLQGDRYVPGSDPKHQGGDVWTTDVALELMEKEEWSLMFLSLAGVDVTAHLTGDHDGPRLHSFKLDHSFEEILHVADAQLGRILDKLQKQNLLESTLIVLTADHGGQGNEMYFGEGSKGVWGKTVQEPSLPTGSTGANWLDKILRTAKISHSVMDSALRLWLEDRSAENRKKALGALSEASGVVEVYEKDDSNVYQLKHSLLSKENKKFQQWAKSHYPQLLESVANEVSPDFIAFLKDEVGYGHLGDHGGGQEKVQRIPIWFSGPGISPKKKTQEFYLRNIRSYVEERL